MKTFFRLFFTDLRWFLGTLAVLAVIIISFILWREINPIGSANVINSFLQDLQEIGKTFAVLVIGCIGLGLLWNKVFSTSSGKRKH